MFRNFVKPQGNYVPRTRVMGSFIRQPVMGMAMAAVGFKFDENDLTLEPTARIPVRRK